ncbi:MAG: NAD(P)H dehydrogenase, partial [Stackebrandtia sp.]
MSTPVNVAIVYYSATGTVHSFATTAADEASSIDGAEVRLRRVTELAPPEAIAANEDWQAHAEATQDIPIATSDDMEWAKLI